jgi:hypothetical protein
MSILSLPQRSLVNSIPGSLHGLLPRITAQTVVPFLIQCPFDASAPTPFTAWLHPSYLTCGAHDATRRRLSQDACRNHATR